tara:strand:- start:430 stop:573 length:144 start_codon:yes stop_codon:yes gene_type:complete
MKCKHAQPTQNTPKPVVKEPVKSTTEEIKTVTFQELLNHSKKVKNNE